jgi:hypothetical protein
MEQGNLFYPPVPKHAPDVTYSRHHGNANSVEANKKSAPFHQADKDRIEKLIRECGKKGMTSAEIEEALGKAKNRFSGRLTQLRAERKVMVSGSRDGCAVLIHCDFEGKA